MRKLTGFSVVLILACVSVALGHAFLDHADPAVGAKVDASPSSVKIWFTEEVEPDFSAIEVRDSNGKEVDNKDTTRDAKDNKLLTVTLQTLSSGEYKVHWHVVASDTHKTEGDFKFTVKPPATTTTSPD